MSFNSQKKYNERLNELKTECLKILLGDEYTEYGLDKIIDLYSSGQLPNSDESILYAIKKAQDITDITDISNLYSLRDAYKSQDFKPLQKKIKGLKEKIVSNYFYKKSHTDSLTDYSTISEDEAGQIPGLEIEMKDGIKIVKLKGAPYTLMAHVGAFEGAPGFRPDSFHASTIDSDNLLSTISYTQAMLIFNNVPPESINYMTTRDSGSESTLTDIKEESALLYDEFKANTGDPNYYTDYQINTADFSIAPDALGVLGEPTTEQLQYASKRGLKTIYAIHEDMYERNLGNAEDYEELLKQYSQTLDSTLLTRLKSTNPNNRTELLNTLSSIIKSKKFFKASDPKLINRNISTINKIYRRDLEDAKIRNIPDRQTFINQLEQINALKEDTCVQIEPGSIEEKHFILGEIQEAMSHGLLKDTTEYFDTLIQHSNKSSKTISSILNFIEGTCNLNELETYQQLSDLCYDKIYDFSALDNFIVDELKQLRRQYLKTYSQISPDALKEAGKLSPTTCPVIKNYFTEEQALEVQQQKAFDLSKFVKTDEEIFSSINPDERSDKKIHPPSTDEYEI